MHHGWYIDAGMGKRVVDERPWMPGRRLTHRRAYCWRFCRCKIPRLEPDYLKSGSLLMDTNLLTYFFLLITVVLC
jgi:hypothetical protein